MTAADLTLDFFLLVVTSQHLKQITGITPGSLEGDSSHPAETAGLELLATTRWKSGGRDMMRYLTWNSILLAIFKFNKLPVALSGFGMDLRESVPKQGSKNADMPRHFLIFGSFDQCATSDMYLKTICPNRRTRMCSWKKNIYIIRLIGK